ncbi:MAG: N-acetylmuramoyl-L-alanine amidase [Alphaproteobacteria bacterium]|nr:N-acetylmuramoyl-L-alanine amidase [Alphaproteobacteria bacterium]
MDTKAYAQSVIKVRYGQHLNTDRLVFDFDRRVKSSVFAISNPDRIVIDVPKGDWHVEVDETTKLSKVKTIRIGLFEKDTSRIVIDMKHATQIEQSFWLPATHGLKDRLVVDFKRVPLGGGNLAESDKAAGHAIPNTQNTQNSLDQVISRVLKDPDTPNYNASYTPKYDVIVPQRKPSQSIRTVQQSTSFEKPLIVIDAGHGGKDSGAVAKSGLYEKTVVLKLAKELARELRKTGRYKVELTRTNDRYIALRKRVSFARKRNADLFISIHADSIENRHVAGASVYTLSEKASDAQTAKLAARENKSDIIAGIDLSTEDPDVTNILLDLVARETTNQSKFFANLIVEELQSHRVKTLERPHRHAGFAVLKAPDVPAVLIETGFMSNSKEARNLNDPNYRKNIVRSLKTGIDSYFVRLAALELN